MSCRRMFAALRLPLFYHLSRPKKIVSSPRAILTPEGFRAISDISSRMFGHARASGTPSIRTATYLPFNLPRPPGALPVHIPEQRTRLTRIPWDSTSPGLYELRVREAPEAGLSASGEGPSHD